MRERERVVRFSRRWSFRLWSSVSQRSVVSDAVV